MFKRSTKFKCAKIISTGMYSKRSALVAVLEEMTTFRRKDQQQTCVRQVQLYIIRTF